MVPASVVSAGPGPDDLFGVNYDPDHVPSSTKGIQATYSEGTYKVSMTNGHTAWCVGSPSMGVVATVHTNLNWVLQGGPDLGRDNSGNYNWLIGWGRFDASGHWTCGNLATLSASTYPSLSGTVKIYYTGSAWILQVYVSQNGVTYSHTYESNIGTSVDGSSQDWDAVETNYQQVGLTLSNGWEWHIERPAFLVGSTWQYYNVQGSNYQELIVYATFQPSKSGNAIGVWPLSTPGAKVYNGAHYNNTQEMVWCISGLCPIVPSP